MYVSQGFHWERKKLWKRFVCLCEANVRIFCVVEMWHFVSNWMLRLLKMMNASCRQNGVLLRQTGTNNNDCHIFQVLSCVQLFLIVWAVDIPLKMQTLSVPHFGHHIKFNISTLYQLQCLRLRNWAIVTWVRILSWMLYKTEEG